MAMHLAKRRRMEFEAGSGSSLSAMAARGVRSTKFDPAQYLQGHGWAGYGVALDGHGGKGLKRPLALPQKRDNKGLGQNRDRAVEWWDCLFEASAKALASKQSSATSSAATSGTNSPITNRGCQLSLQGLAKREQARRQLMSNFRQGITIQMGPTPEQLAKDKEEEERVRLSRFQEDLMISKCKRKSKADKHQKKLAKATKRTEKEHKRSDKMAKVARRAEKEAKMAAKQQKREAKEARRVAKLAERDTTPPEGHKKIDKSHSKSKSKKAREQQ